MGSHLAIIYTRTLTNYEWLELGAKKINKSNSKILSQPPKAQSLNNKKLARRNLKRMLAYPRARVLVVAGIHHLVSLLP
jgi:hypothetical protein